jgi:hypothetical protein
VAAQSGYFPSISLAGISTGAVLVAATATQIAGVGPSNLNTPLVGQGGTSAPAYAAVSGYTQDTPADHTFLEWTGPPGQFGSTLTTTTGSVVFARFVAYAGGTASNVWVYRTAAGTSLTAATTATVSGTASLGGLVEITTSGAHGYSTGDVVVVASVTGTTEANGCWAITVVDTTHFTLAGSIFANAWVSGGTTSRSANTFAFYDHNGALLTCAADQVATWQGGSSLVATAFATPVAMAAGQTYYVALISAGSGTQPTFLASGTSVTAMNANETGAAARYATNPSSGATKLQSAITLSSMSGTNAKALWFAIN